MFGQDDTKDDTQNGATTIEPTTDDTAAMPVVDDATDTVADVVPSDTDVEATETPAEADDQEPAEADPEPDAASATAPGIDEPAADDAPAEAVTETTPPANNDELLELKKEALTDLGPLVSHLDQTPEEHFKTTMMLIQATDNATFVKEAYESAKKISDDAVRAQALLDIVNEINYFTQQHTESKD